ncbi:MAG: C2H2-type zinc finger protein [Thermoplasmata archaeon]|nr:C2H2-type zinc finger protein [Thermoplasmata archaeon]
MDAQVVFRCDACSREFETLEARRAHEAEPHLSAPRPGFTCAACGAPFQTPRELAAHARALHSR